MNWAVTIYSAILFFVLTPGILVRLPPKSSNMVVTATHAVIFALVFHFTHKFVWMATMNLSAPMMAKKEAFKEGVTKKNKIN
jgi:hypothetical protein